MSVDVEQIVRQFIDKTLHMSLATARGDSPWVCEVHFAYDNSLNLYFISLDTRRHSQDIASNPKVAGNIIDKYALGEASTGIYFEGTARLLEAGDEQDVAFECIQNRLKTDDGILAAAATPDGHKFYKITVSNWYAFGSFDGNRSQKYQLAWNGGKS